MKVKIFSWGTEKGLEDQINKWLVEEDEIYQKINNTSAHIQIIDIKFCMSNVGNEDGFSEYFGAMVVYK